jgi:hypothetical protein
VYVGTFYSFYFFEVSVFSYNNFRCNTNKRQYYMMACYVKILGTVELLKALLLFCFPHYTK